MTSMISLIDRVRTHAESMYHDPVFTTYIVESLLPEVIKKHDTGVIHMSDVDMQRAIYHKHLFDYGLSIAARRTLEALQQIP